MGDPDEWWPESDSLPNNSNTRHGLPCEYLYQNLTKKTTTTTTKTITWRKKAKELTEGDLEFESFYYYVLCLMALEIFIYGVPDFYSTLLVPIPLKFSASIIALHLYTSFS